MATHRLEVYVDSYRSRPYVRDFEGGIHLGRAELEHLQEWIHLLAGRPVDLDSEVEIADVKHNFWDGREEMVHSTCVRVTLAN